MTHGARTREEIYNDFRDSLTGKIQTLTNFTQNSFNAVWTRAVSERFRETELQLTAAQFAGWVDYAGGPITEGDLQDLGIADNVDPEELDPYLDDAHLEELVRLVGVERDEGSLAAGTVTFTTESQQTTIDAGTSVGTQPDSNGNFSRYVTTEQVETIDGETTVDAPIESVDVGQDFNAGAGTVTYLPSPPGGVVSVSNAEPVDGGEDRETNNELRERAKQSVFRTSGGGTVEGMIGYIEDNTQADEVDIEEFPSGDAVRDYPHGHVIVSGGSQDNVLEAINESRPVSVEHVLRRPETITVNIDATVSSEQGGSIDFARAEAEVVTYLQNLGLGDDLFEDRLVFTIISADQNIDTIGTFSFTVSDQPFFFDSTKDIYTVQLAEEMVDGGVTEVSGELNGGATTFTSGTDFSIIDEDPNDGTGDDSIDWSTGISSQTTTVSYSSGQTEYDIESIVAIDNLIHNGITSVQNTTTSTTLTEGTDWEMADTTGDNLHNGIRFLNSQNDGDNIDVTYEYGDLPDVLVNQVYSETFDNEKLQYRIDSSLVTDGIDEVTGTLSGSTGHTFVEGTDYEEWDSNGNGIVDGIDWSIGGDQPDDGTTFEVTYDAGTTFLVDYNIEEGDITIGPDEKISDGDINISGV